MRSAALLLSTLRSTGVRPAGRRARPRRREDDVRRTKRPTQRRGGLALGERRVHRAATPRRRPNVPSSQTGFAGVALH
jgi:hypothetical protein